MNNLDKRLRDLDLIYEAMFADAAALDLASLRQITALAAEAAAAMPSDSLPKLAGGEHIRLAADFPMHDA